MHVNSSIQNNSLLCIEYKKKRKFNSYKGFPLCSAKLIIEYSFSGFVLKVEKNHNELRYDVYLSSKHRETLADINSNEIDKFRKFYGKGFNIIIWNESIENL